jgi:hypothetical protein
MSWSQVRMWNYSVKNSHDSHSRQTLWNEDVIVVSCQRQFSVFFSFNNVASILNYRVLNSKMVNNKISEASGHDPRHYPGIFLEGLSTVLS